ncbi:MAG: YkgJ family cysteine cluster protein [Bacteroidota bacterium]
MSKNSVESVAEKLIHLPQRARDAKKSTKKYFAKLAKRPPKKLDATMQELHNTVFDEIDCLECANCCKTTSPIFRTRDVERIAAHLKMKVGDFVTKYLKVDEDEDYVLQSSPCPFLGVDNYCSIYEVRPKACREYPHTDRKNFHQILPLTLKNTTICPATFEIIKRLKEVMPM